MGASSHERKIKSTHRLQHHRRFHSHSRSHHLSDSPTKWLFAPRSSERNQFRYHLAFSTLYASALFLAGSRTNESRSLVARLIKCEIPLSSFAFVNSALQPAGAHARSSSSRRPLLPPFLFHRRTSCFHFPAPSRCPTSRAAHLRTATPFLGRVRYPWTYIAADVDIAWRYRAERRADICLTLIGKCFDLLPAFSALFLSRLAVGAR